MTDVFNEFKININGYQAELKKIEVEGLTKAKLIGYYNRVRGAQKLAARLAHAFGKSSPVIKGINNKYDELTSKAYILCEGL